MSMFDQKHFSEGKKQALDVTESARETEWKNPSFVEQLFKGQFAWNLIHPYPSQSPEDKRIGDEYLAKLDAFLKDNLDPDEIDKTGTIPDSIYEGLAGLGAFALKIPKEYDGMGFSQINYNRAVGLVASYCGSTAVMLSAHQSIGVPQPLKLFGTPEQKKKYLPRFREKYVSAFALTEPDVGSDPAKMTTTATPSEDGSHYLINGLKLWCTNGPVADILIVMAQTPPKIVKGKEKKQITAFIVETKDLPGYEVVHRCRFMGLNGLQNGLLRFTNVKVPKENILWGEGNGLKLALITLNTGRLTVPAATSAMAKLCLGIVRKWSNKRVQWGAEIAKHELVTAKIAQMASDTFAMEAVTWIVSAMADQGKTDMRLEAAMSKLFCTELAWRIADDTVQIRGGRGYETSLSLKGRGEEGIPAERILRDTRINLIIEGTSDIMHLFIAREAMDWHVRLAAPLFDKGSIGKKIGSFLKLAGTYGTWFPKRLLIPNRIADADVPSKLRPHLRRSERYGRKLARSMFICMVRFGPGLEKRQRVLARLVDIGTDLFAVAASISYASSLSKEKSEQANSQELCDLFCRTTFTRIEDSFKNLFGPEDNRAYKVGRSVCEGKFGWMENGVAGSL